MPKHKTQNRRSVGFRLDIGVYKKLDLLCEVNQRSQREIVEILIHNAFEDLCVQCEENEKISQLANIDPGLKERILDEQ